MTAALPGTDVPRTDHWQACIGATIALYCSMPTVRRFSRRRIAMYFGDHPPPHFHVITVDDEEIQVEIETLDRIKGEADPRDTAEALEWESNKEELTASLMPRGLLPENPGIVSAE